jgi:hypothetical protein
MSQHEMADQFPSHAFRAVLLAILLGLAGPLTPSVGQPASPQPPSATPPAPSLGPGEPASPQPPSAASPSPSPSPGEPTQPPSASPSPTVGPSEPVLSVRLDPALTKKFPCIDAVLKGLLKTFGSPDLWGVLWNEKVPKTGVFTNYTLSSIAEDFRKYLTDGQLFIELAISNRDTPAAETVDRKRMRLHEGAGLWMPSRTYSDYGLAVTIAHELVRVWQFDHQWAPTLYPSKNEPAYYIAENHLPKALFDDTRTPDPGGSTPVTCKSSPPAGRSEGPCMMDEYQRAQLRTWCRGFANPRPSPCECL